MRGDVRAIVGYGLLVWLIPFLVAFLIFPLRAADRALFESIMAVVLSACAVWAAVRLFAGGRHRSVRQGLAVGLSWLAISVALDLATLVWGPIGMSPWDYLGDIALTYLMFPLITSGFAAVARCQAAS